MDQFSLVTEVRTAFCQPQTTIQALRLYVFMRLNPFYAYKMATYTFKSHLFKTQQILAICAN